MSLGREEARALLGGLGFGPGSQGSLITLATSGACPGNSGFSSVICTSRSSAMVTWRGEETQRLGGCLLTACLPQPPASSLNTGQCWVRRAPGAKDYSRTQRGCPAAPSCRARPLGEEDSGHHFLSVRPSQHPSTATPPYPLPYPGWKYQGGAAGQLRFPRLYLGATPHS